MLLGLAILWLTSCYRGMFLSSPPPPAPPRSRPNMVKAKKPNSRLQNSIPQTNVVTSWLVYTWGRLNIIYIICIYKTPFHSTTNYNLWNTQVESSPLWNNFNFLTKLKREGRIYSTALSLSIIYLIIMNRRICVVYESTSWIIFSILIWYYRLHYLSIKLGEMLL